MRVEIATLLFACGLTPANAAILQSLEVSPVWSGHPVGFEMITEKGRQYIAFYDDQRRMTVAVRSVDSKEWKFVRLPSQLKWDSHNYVTMAFDREGRLHVSGNMHVTPLEYFRTVGAGGVESLERVKQMVGSNEERCTYPRFLRGPQAELIFTYRDGRSGSGNEIYNIYDEKTRAWRRLMDQPFTDGEGRGNAYPVGPVGGPDGYYHLCWVWRNTPDCSTNHDLSYARSKDMVHWETGTGRPLRLPIRVGSADIVDPVQPQGGIINGNTKLGFDARKRPVITYHKFDAKGRTQIYNARLEDGRWKIYQTTDWDYRWEFSGGGSIPFEIRSGAVRLQAGTLRLDFWHVKYGEGVWRLDEATLKPVETLPKTRPWPVELEKPESEFPGMQVHLQPGKGSGGYMLRWETLGANRDRPRTGTLPAASMLRVYYP